MCDQLVWFYVQVPYNLAIDVSYSGFTNYTKAIDILHSQQIMVLLIICSKPLVIFK